VTAVKIPDCEKWLKKVETQCIASLLYPCENSTEILLTPLLSSITKIMQKSLFLLFLLFLLFSNGCITSTPPELQNLCPVTITVTDKGVPVDGVLVSLFSKQPQSLRGCKDTTNAEGVAKIRTTIRSFTRNGVEAGTYTVVLYREMLLPENLQPSAAEQEASLSNEIKELKKKRVNFMKQNRVIPEILESSETSPIELTVEEKKSTELTIDISKYR
jgi:hypothetical protein